LEENTFSSLGARFDAERVAMTSARVTIAYAKIEPLRHSTLIRPTYETIPPNGVQMHSQTTLYLLSTTNT